MLLTTVDKAVLVTSFTEFERAFGGLDDVGGLEDRTNYLAYAARAFFANGGRRLYVSRVFRFTTMPAAGGRERADRRPGEPDRSGLAGRAARCPRRDVRRHLPHRGLGRRRADAGGPRRQGGGPGRRRPRCVGPGLAAEGGGEVAVEELHLVALRIDFARPGGLEPRPVDPRQAR